jgi:hypothetical protein
MLLLNQIGVSTESLGPSVYEGLVLYNFKLAAKFVSKAHSWQHVTKHRLPIFESVAMCVPEFHLCR